MQKFSKCEKWDDSHVIIFYAPGDVKHGDETVEEYTKHVVVTEASKPAIVEALVRREYSVSDEIAIIRQRTTKKAEFEAYNARVEAIKAEADAILDGLKEE